MNAQGSERGAAVSPRSGGATPTPPRVLPAGASDCHVHVFEPLRFPYAVSRSYTPDTATLAELQTFHATHGIDRVVLVQPSAYGNDNRCMLDGLTRLGLTRARGIAVVDLQKISDDELHGLHKAGVRGIRLNLEVRGSRDPHEASAMLRTAGARLRPFGLLLQIYAELPLIAAVAIDVEALQLPVILDHFGGLRAEDGMQQAGFAELLALLRSERVYVKLSAPYRVSREGPAHADVDAIARHLIDTAPDRMLWGSDWPHTGSASQRDGNLDRIEPFRSEDIGARLDALAAWAGHADVLQQILVDNPASLFEFEEMT